MIEKERFERGHVVHYIGPGTPWNKTDDTVQLKACGFELASASSVEELHSQPVGMVLAVWKEFLIIEPWRDREGDDLDNAIEHLSHLPLAYNGKETIRAALLCIRDRLEALEKQAEDTEPEDPNSCSYSEML